MLTGAEVCALPTGRPSIYSEEMAEKVCELFATARGSLRAAFEARDDLPCLATVYNWEQDNPGFLERLNRARAMRAHLIIDDAYEIADATELDTIRKIGRDGEVYETPNAEWINRSRLRVELRKWHAKSLNQRAYGDKSEQSGQVKVVYSIKTRAED